MTKQKFRIVIVGGGIAGLAAAIALRRPGRSIVVLEKSFMLQEVGALLSLQPNASQIVAQWPIEEFLQAAEPVTDKAFRVFDTTGKLVADIPTGRSAAAERVIYHRQDLHGAFKNAALSESLPGQPVQIRSGAAVARCDATKGIVYLKSGETVEADLIIGADGIRSVVRNSVLENAPRPVPTGLSAYRLLIEVEKLQGISCPPDVFDPARPVTTMIIGHDRRVIMGPGRHGKLLGAVALVPDEKLNDESTAESWTEAGSVDNLISSFSDFPSWLLQIFRASSDSALWQLRDIPKLESWVNGKAILIGDAAHAMLPTQGQGASQSIEDAEALGSFFSDIESQPSDDELRERLHLIFEARHERASKIQDYSRRQARPGTAEGSTEVTLSPEEFSKYNLEYFGAKDWLSKQRLEEGRNAVTGTV